MARKLRWEKEKSRELEAQKQQQQSHLELVEAKRVRLQQKLAELRQSDSDQNILRRLGDAVRLKKYAAEEKLPKEMAVRGQKLANLDRIVNMSAGPKAEEFEQLQEKVVIHHLHWFLAHSNSLELIITNSKLFIGDDSYPIHWLPFCMERHLVFFINLIMLTSCFFSGFHQVGLSFNVATRKSRATPSLLFAKGKLSKSGDVAKFLPYFIVCSI